MDMQHTCAAMLEEIDGALGCIVIDMQTGLAVAAEYRPGSVIDAAAINLVAVISTNMFGGKMIRGFEDVLAQARNRQRPAGFVREVQMTTAATNQFMAAIPGWDDGVFVLVTDKTVSLGLGWMAVHRMIGRVGEGGAWAAPNPQPAPAPPASTRGAAASQSPAWMRTAPSQRYPTEPARYPAQGPVPADPYGRPVQPLAAQLGPASAAASPAMAAQVPPAAQQSPPLAAPVDRQQSEEPEQPVAMGPRMNFMARKRRSAKK